MSKASAIEVYNKNHPNTYHDLFAAFKPDEQENRQTQFQKKNMEYATLASYKDHFEKQRQLEERLAEKYGHKKSSLPVPTAVEPSQSNERGYGSQRQQEQQPQYNNQPTPRQDNQPLSQGREQQQMRDTRPLDDVGMTESYVDNSANQQQNYSGRQYQGQQPCNTYSYLDQQQPQTSYPPQQDSLDDLQRQMDRERQEQFQQLQQSQGPPMPRGNQGYNPVDPYSASIKQQNYNNQQAAAGVKYQRDQGGMANVMSHSAVNPNDANKSKGNVDFSKYYSDSQGGQANSGQTRIPTAKGMYVRGHGGDMDNQKPKNTLNYQHAPLSASINLKTAIPASRSIGSNVPCLY
jgi:hypothetical protein